MIRLVHLFIAALLHAALFGLLLLRVDWSHPSPPTPSIVHGVVLDAARDKLAAERAAEQARRRAAEAEARRKAEAEARRREAEEARRREEANRRRIAEEQERQRREAAAAEARRKAEAEAEAEAKRRAEEAARQKAEAERQRKIAEARRQAEEAQRQREAEERRIREQHRRELEAAMQRETEARRAAERAAQQASDRALWVQLIQDAVQRNWVRPQGLETNFTCVVEVEQLPGGQIISVRIVESCGSPLLDNSVESAVRKSDPLPIAPNPAIFEREIRFTFKPE